MIDLGTGKIPARLLVVVGSDSGGKATSSGGVRVAGNSDVVKFVRGSVPFEQLNLGIQLKAAKQAVKAQGAAGLSHYECVLNLVTDPDQNPRTLEMLARMLRGYRGRVINRPEALLRTTRDQVAKRLAGIAGLRVPRIVRLRNPKLGAASTAAARAGLAFPLIVRRAGTHTGKIVAVVEGPGELDAAAAGPGEFFIIEYVDFRSDDGLYRKYRLWCLGGTTIFRHLIISDQWNVHVNERLRFMLDRDALIAEEVRLLDRPEGALPQNVHDAFDAVKERLGLDFFGMDFAVDRDGQVLLFEANATMNFFPLATHPKFSHLDTIHGPAQAAFQRMLFPEP